MGGLSELDKLRADLLVHIKESCKKIQKEDEEFLGCSMDEMYKILGSKFSHRERMIARYYILKQRTADKLHKLEIDRLIERASRNLPL